MAGVFRLAFHRVAPRKRRIDVQDWRWSLAAADPAAGLHSGTVCLVGWCDGALSALASRRAEGPRPAPARRLRLFGCLRRNRADAGCSWLFGPRIRPARVWRDAITP